MKKILECTGKKCNWTNEEYNIAMSNAIDNKYLEHFSETKSQTENMKAILKIKYNENFAMKAYNDLKCIKQSKFYSIKNYFDKINSIIDQLSICENWEKKYEVIKFKEIFYQGLHEATKIEMMKLGLTSTDAIYTHILQLENTILQERANKFTVHKPNNKYCKKCDTNTHNTTECRRKDSYSVKSKIFSVQERRNNPRALESAGSINEKSINLILDTGSDYSCIAKETLKNLGISSKVQKSKRPMKLLAASGESMQVEE